jgi:dTDP-4-amino-4,6-dideoxygalactose transaminase
MWPHFKPTYARKRIDIRWSDLKKYLYNFMFTRPTLAQSETSLDQSWAPKQTLATYTVRSGFDLFLQACKFPASSEIIISAVTVPDMARIIELYGLISVPVDIQEDGSVLAEDVEELIGRKTKAILIAHLFGNRIPLEQIAAIVRKRELVLIEDCAEAFCGRDFNGNSNADISMFSFGSIKTATAFGGALLTVRNPALLSSMKEIQKSYPQQTTRNFFKKMLKYCFFKFLTDSPYIYGAFLATLQLLRINHNVLTRKWSRSFFPENLHLQIRQRLSAPGLQLLEQRIGTFRYEDLEKRKQRIEEFASHLPEGSRPVGNGQVHHRYWLCPVRVPKPLLLIDTLYQEGFDAADGGTSLAVVSSEDDPKPKSAYRMMSSLVYIPVDHDYGDDVWLKIASLIRRHCEVFG